MTKEQFENIKLPALLIRMVGFSAGISVGEKFVADKKNMTTKCLYDKYHEIGHGGHAYGCVDIIQENYNIDREIMLEIESTL